MSEMNEINVSTILDQYAKEYSIYVLYNRAIPSIIDGLKPVQRKILYTALKHTTPKNKIKTASLGGLVIAETNYAHGDTSVTAAISSMIQEFPGANNIPLLKGEGSHGSRLIPSPAAPRYTSCMINENYFKYFKDEDITSKNTDPEHPEPLYYLPIVPWVLVNGARGIAVGFSTEIQPRKVKHLVSAVREYILTGDIKKEIPPYFKNHKGRVFKEDGKWYIEGVFTRINSNEINITELPIGVTRERYVNHLNNLLEKKIIKDYIDNSKEGFDFLIKIQNRKLTDEKIISLFKLKSSLSENITLIDEDNKLVVFDDVRDVIKRFVDVRLNYYEKRYNNLIEKTNNEIKKYYARLKLIGCVLEPGTDLRKVSRVFIKNLLKDEFDDTCIKFAQDTKLTMLSKEEMKELKNKIKEMRNKIKEWKNINIKEKFIEEVQNV